MLQEVIVKRIRTPNKPNKNEDLNWICNSFGFASNRDKQQTANKIFGIVINASAHNKELSSDKIADMCHLTRGAIIHHINSFLSSGFIVKENKGYTLREQSLTKTIEEVEKDTMRIFSELKKIASELDSKIGLKYR